jgi:hypothetical protein
MHQEKALVNIRAFFYKPKNAVVLGKNSVMSMGKTPIDIKKPSQKEIVRV